MTLVIAECGVNHDGDYLKGYRLIDAAKEAGADIAKFQHFSSRRLWGDSRIEHLQLLDHEMEHLAEHCGDVGIEFACTPFGVPEVEFLTPLVKRWKIASGCLAKKDLLNAVRDTGLPVILSTGMSNIEQVDEALNDLGYNHPAKFGQPITLLHCTSSYPCPISEVNLKAMDVLKHHYSGRCSIGYSDHTPGITIAIAAVGRGAKVSEKHLTLDRHAEGPDHKASIQPQEFKVMVSAIRTVDEAMGDGVKKCQPSEAKTRAAWYG